jgi:predicted nucleotidyltransferase
MAISIKNAKRFLAERKKRRKSILQNKYECAVRDFERIKAMIVERYNPKRIYQWGSLLDESKFREYSDIDIAIEGINDPETFFNIYADAEKLTSLPLDLLDIDKVATEFSQIIKSKGIIVYER